MGHAIHGIPLANTLTEEDAVSIRKLAHDLDAMGIQVNLPNPLPGGTIVLEYDPDAHRRGAGRKKKPLPAESTTQKMTQREMDSWLLNSSIKEISKELGVGRATVFRRRAEARERISYHIAKLEGTDF